MKNISELLKKYNLLHFEFFEDTGRIIYTHDSGTSSHVQDYTRLVSILKENNIKHTDIGIEIIIIEED